jgi:hypothetical protein
MKNEDNPLLKDYYNKYCKILDKVIVEAKNMAYDKYIKKSKNKQKSVWKVINIESGRTPNYNDHHDLIKKCNDSNGVEQINDHFIAIGNKVIKSTISNHCKPSATDFLPFMEQMILNNYSQIINKPSSTKKIEK